MQRKICCVGCDNKVCFGQPGSPVFFRSIPRQATVFEDQYFQYVKKRISFLIVENFQILLLPPVSTQEVSSSAHSGKKYCILTILTSQDQYLRLLSARSFINRLVQWIIAQFTILNETLYDDVKEYLYFILTRSRCTIHKDG